MKTLFKFRYPKLTLLAIVIILAYIIFSNPLISSFSSNLGEFHYLGMLIAGMFFTSGFTAPIAIGFFITANPPNILLSGVIAGVGAMMMDFLILKFIRFSFTDEFESLENTHSAKVLSRIIEKDLGKKIKNYLLYIFAGIFIASPLPDELGVIMLAGLTKINSRVFALFSFIANTIGVLIFLSL